MSSLLSRAVLLLCGAANWIAQKRANWRALALALSELALATIPVGVWVFWLFFAGQIGEIIRKPEISFISLILAAEASRSLMRQAHERLNGPRDGEATSILWNIALIFAALFLGLDIGQYEKQITNSYSVDLILAAKLPVLFAACFSFAWVKYHIAIHNVATSVRSHRSTLIRYNTVRAPQFYDAVAAAYDARNSQDLRQIQLEIVEQIRQSRDRGARANFSVLDLGAGTGRLIAEHFYSQEQVHWVSVDASVGMLEQLRINFSRAKMDHRVIACDILDTKKLTNQVRDKKFDIVVLCYTLSSLPANPSWDIIAKFLKPEGRLLVAEADMNYVTDKPCFNIEVEGEAHQLVLRKLDALQLTNELENAGFKVSVKAVMKGSARYGFIVMARISA
jgi:ubiquinone/menaquinone biosynthesis C-methylase UbiE